MLPAPLPSPDAGPYWEAAARGELVLQRCGNCGQYRFMPSLLCPHCDHDESTWEVASGKGTIHSLTTVHRAPSAEFAEHAPYVLVLVDLAEGPRMMTALVGEDADQATIGDAVTVCFESRADGTAVPQFKRADP